VKAQEADPSQVRADTSSGRDPARAYLEKMRQGNVKVTQNRRRVLARFLEADKPWTLRSLHRSLSQGGAPRSRGGFDLSSVYRALESLREAGLLEEFNLPGEKQTFFSLIKSDEDRKGAGGAHQKAHAHHHHHIACGKCGRVSHLDMCLPQGWIGKAEEASGFRITEHSLEFRGLCGKCRGPAESKGSVVR
jgi:Fur family ferric uptake transcriptional regulator